VINTIQECGSSTIGACGDVSRNVMCPAAPFTSPAYRYARQYSKVFAELFKPQSSAFTDLWIGEGDDKQKIGKMEYWLRDLYAHGFNIDGDMRKDNGNGIITDDPVEPLYGAQYLPRKFKIAVTVPGDNSLDMYINDIGLVTIVDDDGYLQGFNIMVGGGMGRTHNKESTFARIADHLGYVAKDDVKELCKAILAAQRDHGNREVRPNARMKYLVDGLGIEKFKELVEGYFGKKVEPWQEIIDFKYHDYLGWHEQGDGKLFLGINIEQGRVKDYERQAMQVGKAAKVKALLKKIVTDFGLTMILTPSQSVIFKDILPEQKANIDKLLKQYGVTKAEDVDTLVAKSIACPAFPLCGLAIAEAERRMPEWQSNMRALMEKVGLAEDEQMILRMTGCPNGCARPYMAELALVGDGPDSYQLWTGGSPNLTKLASVFLNKVKWADMDNTIEPLLFYWKVNRKEGEAFGDLCSRVGNQELERFSTAYAAMKEFSYNI
jgi:sulfite reductase (ferredoxin)